MSDVAEALRRAKIRIRYHGWRRSTDDPKTPGWTLTEAIVGRKPTVIPEFQLRALVAVVEAIGVSQGELDEWNDAPYRTQKDVLKALARARKAVEAPPATVPDRCAQRRMEAGGDVIGADDPQNLDELMATPAPWEAAEGEGPLSSIACTTQGPVAGHYAPSEWEEEQVDLEEVIKNHLRGR